MKALALVLLLTGSAYAGPKAPLTLEERLIKLQNTVDQFIYTQDRNRQQLIDWNKCHDDCQATFKRQSYDDKTPWDETPLGRCTARCNQNTPPEIGQGC